MIAELKSRAQRSADATDQTLTAGVRRTNVGWIAALWREADDEPQLLGIAIGHPSPATALKALPDDPDNQPRHDLSARQEDLLERLAGCATGQVDHFDDVPLNLDHLAPFARQVVQRCRKIPPGETMTYAQLAAACGSPGAARAVGNVMASNRFPLVVPCHRVVGSGGGLGGFSAPRGIELKRELLRREGVEI